MESNRCVENQLLLGMSELLIYRTALGAPGF
jgi:hypothetical protein